MPAFRIGMLMLHLGTPRDQEAREQLADALPDAAGGAPHETGAFEIELEADDQERALQRIWDAVAASGTDDHIVFLEHPDLPEHWRRVAGGPTSCPGTAPPTHDEGPAIAGPSCRVPMPWAT